MTRLIPAALAALMLCACAPNPALVRYEQEENQRERERAAAHRVSDERVDCMRNHRADLRIGMSQKEVLATCWNFVSRAHKSETAEHVHDQWVYEIYNLQVYAHFTDYVLTSISN